MPDRGVVVALLLATWVKAGAGETVARHVGKTDPRREGFALANGLPPGCVGVVDDDAGHDAVFIDDSGMGESNYVFDLTARGKLRCKVLQGRYNGWVLRTRLRAAEPGDTVDTGIRVEFTDRETRWQMQFGSDAKGRPLVGLGRLGRARETHGVSDASRAAFGARAAHWRSCRPPYRHLWNSIPSP